MIVKDAQPTSVSQSEDQFDEPQRMRVIIYNDEVTTQEFVVLLLVHLFQYTVEKAIALMLEVHLSGAGVAGIYTHDVALFKRQQAIKMARDAQYPLKIECEKVE
ncbi:ATP-dependent Clp protease adaptor ClpS [Entomospira culicis]|uniref:ATP-dependent Clp protease adapter protein ClpS n=1 Tax=Entomospira culicis TaxID=2719989 RepID=A0A968GF59_9SPIO|nr:ATP-dependent Clp protease adaptor ClpS [Entomospira culicis]NIZ19619.1 ATP-dependent Clp protease adaptor ClpS [Entomospira culicis]NIZ69476.1 ATP-dependent Clp protease adaptor ClpS [Entomospira culicis]WDI36591.1 ATP-dependent Clp protease adaptor ClpS [Entomospira culicis]WDI38219.1 ATP-dependent Clp protease adaptor ClpS [Entomospira culicis]